MGFLHTGHLVEKRGDQCVRARPLGSVRRLPTAAALRRGGGGDGLVVTSPTARLPLRLAFLLLSCPIRGIKHDLLGFAQLALGFGEFLGTAHSFSLPVPDDQRPHQHHDDQQGEGEQVGGGHWLRWT